MDKPKYEFEGPVTEYRYNFTSVSTAKEVEKIVRFSATSYEGIYNLSLLDRWADGGESSDKAETKNKDMDKVLATVLQIVVDFLDKNPDWVVYIEGSEAKRKRLYQILLNREYDQLKEKYKILGIFDGYNEVEPFEKAKNYDSFMISKR